LAAVEIVCGNEHPVSVRESGIDEFAVGGRGAGSETVKEVFALEVGGENGLLPKQPAGAAV
jgi:hypothetical protein